MNEKQWVQHISGQGEKWEYLKDTPFDEFCVYSKKRTTQHYLPKSEYRFCDPPETWLDVTSECRTDNYGAILHEGRSTQEFPYRRRKVQFAELSVGNETKLTGARWAFIIEKKES